MLIRELFTEAISVTRYEEPLNQAVISAIQQSFKDMAHEVKGTNQELEQSFNDNNQSHTAYISLMTNELEKSLRYFSLPEFLEKSINDAIGSPTVEAVIFKSIPSDGHAAGTSIVLNAKYASKIAQETMSRVFSIVYDNFDGEERVDGLYSTFKDIINGDRHALRLIKDGIQRSVEDMVDTILHELVHVIQHKQQHIKGRYNTEYRSYLDKRKGEFIDLHRDEHKNSEKSNRWHYLYRASPQEIAAFAHNAALYAIRSTGLNAVQDASEIYELSPEEITYAVDKFASTQYSEPKNAFERKVRNRYLKLTYLEIQRFINDILDRLKKNI